MLHVRLERTIPTHLHRTNAIDRLKPGFHSNALRKEKYASKIKSAQETQQTQENQASKKQKYASANHKSQIANQLTQANATIESILFFTLALRALRAFEWKPGLIQIELTRAQPDRPS